jgi:hypothetical protein
MTNENYDEKDAEGRGAGNMKKKRHPSRGMSATGINAAGK